MYIYLQTIGEPVDIVHCLMYNDCIYVMLFSVISQWDTWDDYYSLDVFLEKKTKKLLIGELIIWATECWCSLMNA